MFRITPLNLHWLNDSLPSETDLCAHAAVRVEHDGETLLATDSDDYAVSTGALHLLRTLESDHTPEAPMAEHLVPHCGHFMFVDHTTGDLRNLGCSSGLNWWVRHSGHAVTLEFASGTQLNTQPW